MTLAPRRLQTCFAAAGTCSVTSQAAAMGKVVQRWPALKYPWQSAKEHEGTPRHTGIVYRPCSANRDCCSAVAVEYQANRLAGQRCPMLAPNLTIHIWAVQQTIATSGFASLLGCKVWQLLDALPPCVSNSRFTAVALPSIMGGPGSSMRYNEEKHSWQRMFAPNSGSGSCPSCRCRRLGHPSY